MPMNAAPGQSSSLRCPQGKAGKGPSNQTLPGADTPGLQAPRSPRLVAQEKPPEQPEASRAGAVSVFPLPVLLLPRSPHQRVRLESRGAGAPVGAGWDCCLLSETSCSRTSGAVW